MSGLWPIHPDPMPLREALRALRHLLRRGGETVREAMPLETLPGPAADLAGAVLREAEHLARNVDAVASGLAKRAVGAPDGPAPPLGLLIADPDAEATFAAATYAALKPVLQRLGTDSAFVSEAAARRAFADLRQGPTGAGDGLSAVAAALVLALLSARVVRDASHGDAPVVPAAALAPVAVFAVLLWLMAERAGAEDAAALDAATDLAVAIAADVAAACTAGDRVRLAALLDEFAPHV